MHLLVPRKLLCVVACLFWSCSFTSVKAACMVMRRPRHPTQEEFNQVVLESAGVSRQACPPLDYRQLARDMAFTSQQVSRATGRLIHGPCSVAAVELKALSLCSPCGDGASVIRACTESMWEGLSGEALLGLLFTM